MVSTNINFTPYVGTYIQALWAPDYVGEENVSVAFATSETNTINYNIMHVPTAKTLQMCVS